MAEPQTTDYETIMAALYYPMRDDATWEKMQKKCHQAIAAFQRLVPPPVSNKYVALGCEPFGVSNDR